MPKTKITVLGGAVMDLVFRVAKLPNWKQAVQAHSFQLFPGGKGLNQALAASRLDADVALISAVGKDAFGKEILSTLQSHTIALDFVDQVTASATAVTNVFVNYEGEAAFVGWKSVLKEKVDATLVQCAEERIGDSKALLITLEVSLSAVEAAITIAKSYGTIVLLNPAPPLDPPDCLPHNILQDVTVVIPNVWEATELLRQPQNIGANQLAMKVQAMGVKIACVTTSELGCVVATHEGVKEYPSFVANPRDTTGGSDAFCAALALALAEGKDFEDAIMRANAAGALAVGKFGGSPSMPTTTEIDNFLRTRRVKKT